MAAIAYGSLPFSEQIRFFRGKRNVLTESWLDVYGAEHDVGFMVAGANRDDLVADFRAAIEKAIADGTTLEAFRKDFDRIVEQYGWDYTGGRNWRSRIIYETNLRQSYNAGRWDQLQRLKRARPYWRYRHSDAVEHPRPIHLGWDGLVLHADDVWWLTHFPSNGWGCQCYVEALSERDLKRLGKSGPDQAPPIDMQTVVVGQRSPGGPRLVQTPNGVDPGFGYAPGRSLGGRPPPDLPNTPPSLVRQLEATTQVAIEKAARMPALAAAQSTEQVLALPRAAAALDAGYAEWQSTVVATSKAQSGRYMIGALHPESVTAMATAGAEPATAAIVVRDADLLRGVGSAANAAADWARLPIALRSPVAVLIDPANASVVQVVNVGRRQVAVTIEYQRAIDSATRVNLVRTIEPANLTDMRNQVASGRLALLRGSLGGR